VFFVAIIFGLGIRLHRGRGLFAPVARLLSALASRKPGLARTGEKMEEIDRELILFFRHSKGRFFLAYVCSVLHRFPEVIEYYVIFHFLSIDATLLSCVAVSVGVTVFKALGSFIPGQLGVEEYGNKVMLDFISIPGGATWLSVSIIRRARQVIWIILGVLAFLYMVKIRGRAGQEEKGR
jgi:hypothetical protein